MAKIIDGAKAARALREFVKQEVLALKHGEGQPGLATILVGEDPASQIYIRNKRKHAAEAGIESFHFQLAADVSEAEVLVLIDRLNQDEKVHGILVQLPLPKHIDARSVIGAIAPAKDVDGFHISNVGLLSTGQKSMVPCTPFGCLLLLQAHFETLAGKHAVIIGRSNIVGKPLSQLLLAEDCTVTVAHSQTQNLAQLTRQADILIAAVGRPELVTKSYVKTGAVVIDIGINRIERDGKSVVVGDVDFQSVSEVAGAITPVPGGVGPMTIACLLYNTLVAFSRAHELSEPIIRFDRTDLAA